MVQLSQIQTALSLQPPFFDPQTAQRRMAPQVRPVERDPHREGEARYAATLLLLYPKNQQLYFVLTRRPETLKSHAGQISFPGGRREPHEDFTQTALRETCEELGICEPIQIIGKLSQIYIPPSDFYVSPFVGYLPQVPRWNNYNPSEVAEVIECPVDLLLDETIKQQTQAEFGGQTFQYGYYQIGGHRVWGATAIILSEFEGRIRASLG